ncbi:MAG: helix-hairpin-helix domain-containing protein [Dehalococcoidia bacterium]|nr:helix-hairpin-helix domain-containing protein [Dehalococcoidia bacterium]
MPDGTPAAKPPSPRSASRPSPATLLNVALIALAVIALIVLSVRERTDSAGVEVQRREAPVGVDDLAVYVTGAVASPGVVTAAPGDRIADVVDRAGGALPEANLDALNLALRVRDEDAVHVPFEDEATAVLLIDVNSASQDTLERLPGIGAARARAIVDARPLTSVEDLVDRALVPESVWEEIRTLVTAR